MKKKISIEKRFSFIKPDESYVICVRCGAMMLENNEYCMLCLTKNKCKLPK